MKKKKKWCFCPNCGKYIVICDGDDEGGFLNGYCKPKPPKPTRGKERKGVRV